MSRVYVPWRERPNPKFRGISGLVARLAVLHYRVFGPIIRRFPGPIFVVAVIVACLLAWAFTGLFETVADVDSFLRRTGAQPAGAQVIPGLYYAPTAWSLEQVQKAASSERVSSVLPAMLLWPFQFSLLRDLISINGIVAFVSLVAMVGIWGERKVAGHIQSRPGPMRVGGWHGWSQSLADGIKLLSKEDLIPDHADRPLFRLAPYLAFVPSLCAYIVLPFGVFWVFRDLDVGLLFILASLGIEVMGVILAGWASNNKWSLFGGMREACQVVSYEIPMGMSLLIPVMVAGSLRFGDVAKMQDAGWFSWIAFHSPWTFVAMFTYFIASLAACKRAPFDLPEGESELVSGFHTEYSGFRWSLFFFAEYAAMFAVSGIATILFLGAWHGPWAAPEWLASSTNIWHQLIYGMFFNGPLIFVAKCSFLMYLQMWIRWTLPRIRIDQVLYSCVQVMLPLVMVTLLGSTLWELVLGWNNTAFAMFAMVCQFALGIIGIIATIGTLYIIWYGFSNRRSLVGTLATDLLPGA